MPGFKGVERKKYSDYSVRSIELESEVRDIKPKNLYGFLCTFCCWKKMFRAGFFREGIYRDGHISLFEERTREKLLI